MRNSKGQFVKGNIPSHKGRRMQSVCEICGHLMDKYKRDHKGRRYGARTCSKICGSEIVRRVVKNLYATGKRKPNFLGQKRPEITGINNPRWIKDRTRLAKRQERNDMAYKEWRRQVWIRDKFKCKISNQNCLGRIEAHHILGWTAYPELRYEVNNGITLCHFHHPRKRKDEMILSPFFQELIKTN